MEPGRQSLRKLRVKPRKPQSPDATNFSEKHTVKPRYTGPKSNGNPPIVNAKLWPVQTTSLYLLHWH